jgi:putative salt-induced outer membrane protein
MTHYSYKSASAIALTTAVTLLSTTAAYAEEAAVEEVTAAPAVKEAAVPVVEEVSPWTTSAELGFLYKTGNVKSLDVKAGLKVNHEKGQWLNLVSVDILAKKLEEDVTDGEEGEKSFETTDSKWAIAAQSNYTLEPDGKNYLYGNLSYAEDRFSSFDLQSSVSMGWGRKWYTTETVSFFSDIGPGYKHDEISEVETTTDGQSVIAPSYSEDSFIVQAQALYINQLNPYVEFRQYLIGKYAPDSEQNSTYKSETSLTSKLMESLQVKFTLTFDYNTEVEEEFENLDTQTALTLVYSF